MKISVLSKINRINRGIVNQGSRLYSFKYDISARAANKKDADDVPVEAEENEIGQNTSFRYSLNQGRTSAIDYKTSVVGDAIATKKQNVKARIEEQHLQPSMLPAYFQKSMETDALVTLNSEINEKDKISQARRFQPSKTCANATLPLKSVKLASPFPEPVKMMMSRTVSDEEKAMQMLADARSQRHFAEQSRGSSSSNRTLHTGTKRWYSNIVGRSERFQKLKGTALDSDKSISTDMKNSEKNSSSEQKRPANQCMRSKKRCKEMFLVM